jgi:Tripartite tricarboxylate transporter family receptor
MRRRTGAVRSPGARTGIVENRDSNGMAEPGASGRVAIGSHIYTVDLQDAETRRQPGVTRASREDAMNRRRVALAIALFALTFPSGSALAQTYPNRPIRIIVPFAAGGAVDSLARLLGNKLSEQLNQPVVVENRAGAGGNLAPDALAKAAPDGYTILLTTNGLAISPSLYRTLPFDVHKDFVPVTQVVASQLVIAAHPKLAANSIAELIALAKAKPGGLNYGSTGIGNPLHLTMEMLKTAAGIDIQAAWCRWRRPCRTCRTTCSRRWRSAARSAPRRCPTCRRWRRPFPASSHRAGRDCSCPRTRRARSS